MYFFLADPVVCTYVSINFINYIYLLTYIVIMWNQCSNETCYLHLRVYRIAALYVAAANCEIMFSSLWAAVNKMVTKSMHFSTCCKNGVCPLEQQIACVVRMELVSDVLDGMICLTATCHLGDSDSICIDFSELYYGWGCTRYLLWLQIVGWIVCNVFIRLVGTTPCIQLIELIFGTALIMAAVLVD